jgi:hypothetical protein
MPADDWTRVVFRSDLYSTPEVRQPTQRKADSTASAGQEQTVSLPGAGGGSAMPRDVQAKMESALGSDFSGVRIHEGSHASDIGALAYTQGTDIHFASGQYRPHEQSGQELLGHELTHVVQQSQGRVPATTQAKGAAVNDDPALEREADAMGARAARGESTTAAGGAGSPGAAVAGQSLQRAEDPNATGNQTGSETGATASAPTPGSATVVGAAEDSEYAFDNSFTPALVASLQSNPNLSLDEVLANLSGSSLGAPATDNDGGLHHPTIVQYGQTDASANECRDNQKTAVLIPNQNYVNISPLGTPIAEANAMSSELAGRGYDSNVHPDKTSAEMSGLWNGMVNAANEGDDLVAFYGGHGSPEGLCGINDDLPPNPSDTFTNSQVAGVVSAATTKGAHIRFIMDSCHSGSAAQTVREERENELAQNADSLGDHVRVAALAGLRTAKQSLLDHCHEREQVLQKLDDAIVEHQGKEPDASATIAHAAWATILTGLQTARTTVQSAYDRKADAMWGAMSMLLVIVKAALSHPEAPPPITDYRTLGAQNNYLDDLWNACAQPMERDLAQGSGT